MKLTVRVEGLKELDRALAELPRATGKNVLKRVLTKRAQPIIDDARSRVRRDEGDLAGSGGVGTKLSPRQASLHRKLSDVEVFAGFGPLPQAITEEFGTFRQEANPSLRPAWDQGKHSALDGIAADLGVEIDKAAKRLARRRAKG